jgi:hypothetical protein
MKGTSCNVACQGDSWCSCQFHPGERKMSDEEILQSLLVGNLFPDSPSRFFNPIAFQLVKFEWAIFGTCSFQRGFLTYDANKSEELRKAEVFRLLGVACAVHRIKTRRLLFYGKTEWGENKRGHYHFLIGRQGAEHVEPAALAATLQDGWTNGPYRRGVARIEPFRQELHREGVLYQSKYEFDATGERLPTNEAFSPMLQKLMRRNAAVVL